MAAFVAGLTAEANRFAPTTGAMLVERFEVARAAWPGIAITDVEFARDLARRLGKDASPEALAACRTAISTSRSRRWRATPRRPSR